LSVKNESSQKKDAISFLDFRNQLECRFGGLLMDYYVFLMYFLCILVPGAPKLISFTGHFTPPPPPVGHYLFLKTLKLSKNDEISYE
jgi:hypothetical protein